MNVGGHQECFRPLPLLPPPPPKESFLTRFARLRDNHPPTLPLQHAPIPPLKTLPPSLHSLERQAPTPPPASPPDPLSRFYIFAACCGLHCALISMIIYFVFVQYD